MKWNKAKQTSLIIYEKHYIIVLIAYPKLIKAISFDE